MAKFELLRDCYFDVTTDDAIEVVMADLKKTLEAREEDAEFIRRLRNNEYVAFGARDWDQQKRFDRALERQEKDEARVENERKRKLVSFINNAISYLSHTSPLLNSHLILSSGRREYPVIGGH